MQKYSLVPRLNYNYSLRDCTNAIRGLSRKQPDCSSLRELFDYGNFFFVNHGRTGLRIALTALSLRPGSRIGVSAYNCRTVFQAIEAAGHNPVFIDITKDLKLDTSSLEKQGGNLDALIVTHLFGLVNAVDEIKRIIPGIPVIEDCAHAFLSGDDRNYAGTEGDFGVFSMGKGKFPSIGDGGIILVNNSKYLDRTRELTQQLPACSLADELLNITGSILLSVIHNPLVYGIFTRPFLKSDGDRQYRNSSFRGKAILKSNLSVFLNGIDNYRQSVGQHMHNARNNIEVVMGLDKPGPDLYVTSGSNWNHFMLPVLSHRRDLLIDNAKKNGYELGRHFSHSVEWAGQYGYMKRDCPVSEYVAENIIAIPTYYKMRRRNESID